MSALDQYGEAFGRVGSKTIATQVITQLKIKYTQYYPDGDFPATLLDLSKCVNTQLNLETDRVHSMGMVMCFECETHMYDYCSVCIGPHTAPTIARSNAIDPSGLCDTCASLKDHEVQSSK